MAQSVRPRTSVLGKTNPYLVNQGKAQTQGIGDSSSTLGATRIRTDNDGIPEIWNLSLNIPLNKWLSVKVVNGNVKESLVSIAVFVSTFDAVSFPSKKMTIRSQLKVIEEYNGYTYCGSCKSMVITCRVTVN